MLLTKEQLQQAIKGQRWDKHTYCYAIGAMNVHSAYSIYPDSYKLQQCKDEFYRLAAINQTALKSFTTFKHLYN